MSLFRRRTGRHAAGNGSDPDAVPEIDELDGSDDTVDTGPYDVADAPEDGLERLDLGSLRIPAVPGVEVRMQASQDGNIGSVVLVAGPSAMQLGAFAAPRSAGIWDDVRAELRSGIAKEGGTVTETDGEYGVELRAKIRTPEGPAEVRFVGVDGPRWLVRALFQGPVAVDPAAAEALLVCLRGLVVDRGREAMPIREALPLRLPRELAEQAEAQQAAQAGPDGAAVGTGGRGRHAADETGPSGSNTGAEGDRDRTRPRRPRPGQSRRKR